MLYIYNNNDQTRYPIENGFTTAYQQIQDLFAVRKWEIEYFDIEDNADAKANADKYNLTVFPVLVEIADDEHGNLVCEKIAEGLDAILLISDDDIKRVEAKLAKSVPTPPPA